MTDNSSRLSVLDWIRLTAKELRALGVDPDDRIHFTGHASPLPEVYVPSVGNWALYDTDDLIDREAPHLGLVRVKYAAFRQFRCARGLMTRSAFESHHGPIHDRPWLLAELSWSAHSRAQEVLRRTNGTPGSFGQACARAVQDASSRDTPSKLRLGIMPVEVVLWARIFDGVLRSGYVSYDEWTGFGHGTKHAYWELGHTTIVDIANEPAIRHLSFYTELAAAG
jgi:hypothetical protein